MLEQIETGIIVAVASTIIIGMLTYIIKQNATKRDVQNVQGDLDKHKVEDTNALVQIKERLSAGNERMRNMELDIRENRESSIRQEEHMRAQDVVQDKILTLVTEIKTNGHDTVNSDKSIHVCGVCEVYIPQSHLSEHMKMHENETR